MEFLCHASATDHVAPLEDPHPQSRHAEVRCTGQAVVTGSDYDRIEIGHGFAIKTGLDRSDNFRRAATYVDRILKGEKPSELPVQAPVKFDLVINLKAAKALGLEPKADIQPSPGNVCFRV